MSRTWLVLCATGVVACSGGAREEAPVEATVVDSPLAHAALERLGAHPRHIDLEDASAGVVLERGLGRFRRTSAGFVPSFDTQMPPHARVAVTLPERADLAATIEDVSTHRALSFVLMSAAKSSKADVADGMVLYAGAIGGADMVQRPVPEGTEDFVFFDAPPVDRELRYRVDVSQFSGLRLVGNAVEYLDDRGIGRLRTASPWVYDAHGVRHEGTLSIEGCAYNADARLAETRKIVPPGASSCDVVVRWEAGLAHPIVVDPTWSTTGAMKTKRKQASTVVFIGPFGGDTMYVAGGFDGTSFLNSVEYCIVDSTPPCTSFSSAPSMTTARSEFPLLWLYKDELTIFGGRTATGATGATNTAEYLKTSSSAWTATTNTMSAARASYRAVDMGLSTVLITGGSAGGLAATNTVDSYDPTTHSFTAKAAMKSARWGHAIAALSSNSVLVAGGYDGTGVVSSGEIYTVSTNTWATTTTSLAVPRIRHTAVVVNDVVLFTGGTSTFSGGPPLPSTDLFTIATGKFSAGPSMTNGRELLTTTILPGSRVLAAGGGSRASTYLSSAELYDRATNAWIPAGTMTANRGEHVAIDYGSDVFVIGGTDSNTGTNSLSSVEHFVLDANSVACTDGRTCLSGFCVDGVCCSTASCSAGAKCNNPTKKGSCSKALGIACASNGECDASHCVDGVCCDGACTGTCQACTAALKGTGSNGNCGNIANGVASSECASTAASGCGTDGTCDGAGACRKFAATTQCNPASCSGTVASPADFCNGTGACVDAGTKDCAPFLCSAGACSTSCVNDSQCAAGGYCDSGVCKTDLPNGGACVRAAQCGSGFCVDGVCCNTACNTLCQACAQALKEDDSASGTCGLAKANTDAHNDCAVDATTTCGKDGTCDGGGKCKLYKPGTGCGSVVCDGTTAKGQLCDGFGTCKSDSTGKNCAPFKCVDAVGCKTTCTIDTDCVDGNFCDPVTKNCLAKSTNGAKCTAGISCGSGICVIAKGATEGVCCNTPCSGQCETCLLKGAEGTCVPTPNGPPVDGKDACSKGADVCSATACNGVERASCAGFEPSTTNCKPASCTEGIALLAANCTGTGTCAVQATAKCEPYVCADDKVCGTTCNADTDCAAKFRCDTSTHDCVPRDTNTCSADGLSVVATDNTQSSCSPYVCQAGACKGSCGTTADCAPGNICDTSSGRCNPAPNENDSGCGCSTPGATTSSTGALAVLLALVTLRRRAPRSRGSAGTKTARSRG